MQNLLTRNFDCWLAKQEIKLAYSITFPILFLQKRLKEMEDLVLVLDKEEEAFLGAKDSKGKFSRITY